MKKILLLPILLSTFLQGQTNKSTRTIDESALYISNKKNKENVSVNKLKAKDIKTDHIHVLGDQEICGDLYVDGFIVSSSLDVLEDATIGCNLNVGCLLTASALEVLSMSLADTLSVSSLEVLSDVTIGCNLDVGCTTTTSALDVQNDANVSGNLTVSSLDVLNDASISSIDVLTNLTVGNNTTTSSLDVLNNASISSLDVLTNLIVGNNTTTSTLDVLGNANIGGNLASTGSVSACDVIVGCNILMQNSTSPLIGNVLKNNASFIHNTGIDNTFMGINAGNFTQNGAANTAFGSNALPFNTSGGNNTAVGSFAMSECSSGNNNIGIGVRTLNFNAGGSDNIAIGTLALSTNLNGQGNVAVGINTLSNNRAGSNNLALGRNTLLSNVTGNLNIALGNLAGVNIIGSNNITIGNLGAGGDSDTIRIGSSHTRAFVAGIRGVATGAVDAIPVLIDSLGQLGTISSSQRFKHHIEDIGTLSDRLMQLRPVMFNYTSDESNQRNYGFIAEEVARIYPELVVFDQDGNPYTVKYHLLYALLLNEIQNNHRAIADLQEYSAQRDAHYTHAIEALTARIIALERIQ